MRFRDNKIAIQRREVAILGNKYARRLYARAVRRAKRMFIEDSAN